MNNWTINEVDNTHYREKLLKEKKRIHVFAEKTV